MVNPSTYILLINSLTASPNPSSSKLIGITLCESSLISVVHSCNKSLVASSMVAAALGSFIKPKLCKFIFETTNFCTTLSCKFPAIRVCSSVSVSRTTFSNSSFFCCCMAIIRICSLLRLTCIQNTKPPITNSINAKMPYTKIFFCTKAYFCCNIVCSFCCTSISV